MLSLTTSLVPLVLAGLLGWTGAVKVFSRGTAQQAPKTALARMLRSSERATTMLRATGAGELLIAAGLLAVPANPVPGAATAVLGAGFLGPRKSSRSSSVGPRPAACRPWRSRVQVSAHLFW
ncbi:hypothetical protein [Streptomyces sp. NPDC002785]|uniref:hypothetical protein n=1 Tax=Streptomyces sp. NPDC002785 TaxID=3154543 RepID=UPI00331DEDB7